MQVFEELRARGLLAQLTDEEEIRELVNAGKATFYIGFDPTADSLGKAAHQFRVFCLDDTESKHFGILEQITVILNHVKIIFPCRLSAASSCIKAASLR